MKMKVCNIDSVTLLSTVPFVVYDKNPTLIQANIIYESVLGKDVKSNNCEIIEFNLDLLHNEDYYIVVNDNGGKSTPFSLNVDFPSTNVFECNFENNILGFMTNSIDSTFITKTLITGESVQIGQETYSTEGNYVQNLSNIFGCDSTLFISDKYYKC
ncbi:MAG: hypothetical protein IPN86_24110 [Saprospiraceae bacterium]|nr:hypothetical protein [Saprospiraceae bacterium]